MLITLLTIGGTSLGYADDSNILNNIEIHSHDDNIITPMYDAHPCHSGIDHRKCESSVLRLDCGCKLTA